MTNRDANGNLIIKNPYEWTEIARRFHPDGSLAKIIKQRIVSGVTEDQDELEICEEWYEAPLVDEAARLADGYSRKLNEAVKPLAVIPQAVQSKAINEGWVNDSKQWKKWINDSDNSRLRITGGRA
jgi:hypothetical protein